MNCCDAAKTLVMQFCNTPFGCISSLTSLKLIHVDTIIHYWPFIVWEKVLNTILIIFMFLSRNSTHDNTAYKN